MNQPNNPCPTCGQYNNIICSNSYHLWVEPEIEADSLHVGETVELGLTQMEISESVDKMADRYASWFGVYNDPEWNKLRLAYLAGERLGRIKQELSEAGESKHVVTVTNGDVTNLIVEVNSAPNETNVSPCLYTHEQVLAFGEKVKELAAENGTIRYIESETKDGIIDAEVDKESILSIDLNKIEIK